MFRSPRVSIFFILLVAIVATITVAESQIGSSGRDASSHSKSRHAEARGRRPADDDENPTLADRTVRPSAPGTEQARTTWHVDDDTCPESGAGTQADPFCLIQDCIDAAYSHDTCLVAPGTYYENIDMKGTAVTLRSSDGPETTIIQPGERGALIICASGEGPDTVIDGFTITDSKASGCFNNRICGGGMRNVNSSSPTVINCIFSDNVSGYGGGMFNNNSSPTVTNCTFIRNEGTLGAGMANINNASPTVSHCSFLFNTTTHDGDGGGMYNERSSPRITSCSFHGNSTLDEGGGIFSTRSTLTVTNCGFTGNRAPSGAGMHNSGGSTTVTNCSFLGNHGGGMRTGGGSVTVTNCSFSKNTCSGMDNARCSAMVTNCTFTGNFGLRAGGMCNGSSSAMVTNCTFTGNTTDGVLEGAGGMSNRYCSPTVTNCTFTGNTTDDVFESAGGMFNRDSSPTVTNCILWGNGLREIGNAMSTPTITYSIVQGGYAGVGNNHADPLFVDPDGDDNLVGTSDDDVHLSPGSPAIDAANNLAVPSDGADLDGDGDTNEPIPVDLDGNPRFVDDPDMPDLGNPDRFRPLVDMGAYEFQVVIPPPRCLDVYGDGTVTICRFPHGDPSKVDSMAIGRGANPAHRAHDDQRGSGDE